MLLVKCEIIKFSISSREMLLVKCEIMKFFEQFQTEKGSFCNDLLRIINDWKNLIDGVELVGIVECPPPVGRGRVGINFAVNLKRYDINFCVI